MLDLSREYSQAEREYDLAAFDANPDIFYELTVCYSSLDKKNLEEEVLCVKNTMREIKDEISGLSDRVPPEMEGIIVIAYEEDDSCPTPAYLVVRKELEGRNLLTI